MEAGLYTANLKQQFGTSRYGHWGMAFYNDTGANEHSARTWLATCHKNLTPSSSGVFPLNNLQVSGRHVCLFFMHKRHAVLIHTLEGLITS